jgi:hypothetical protein
MFCCFEAKFIIDQENQILFRLLDTFYSFILNFIYCPRKTRNPSPAFLLCLLLLANENTDRLLRINLAKAKARSKSVSVNTPMGIADLRVKLLLMHSNQS